LRRAYLSNVCVATAARRQGVAAALMTAAEDLARSLGEQGSVARGQLGAVNPVGRLLSDIVWPDVHVQCGGQLMGVNRMCDLCVWRSTYV
jgi:ribosomal protein S18 acetylase RimI-like enzyme